MSDKVTVDGLTIWNYPRSTMNSVIFALLGAVLSGFGIYALATELFGSGTEGKIGLVILILCGLPFVIIGSYSVGSSEIVFDDNTESIYLNKRSCCCLKKSTKKMGPYSEFKECVLKEERKRGVDINVEDYEVETHEAVVYSIDFIFSNSRKNIGTRDSEQKEEKAKLATDINEWWKTTSYYEANQPAAPLLREQADSELSGVPIPCLC